VRQASSWWSPNQAKKKKRKRDEKHDHPGIINDRPFITLIVGKKGSGKSVLCCNLLLTTYRYLFDRIIIVSPTFRAQYGVLWHKISSDGIVVHEELNETIIQSVYDEVKSNKDTATLLLLDDCGEELRKIEPRLVNLMVSNSRHYKLSILSLHQKLTQAPTILRGNADQIMMFGACSYLEREALYKEVSIVDRKTFMRIFNHATDEPHSFLCCVMSREGQLKFYKHDFETEIKIENK
jgi:hypothetical protein